EYNVLAARGSVNGADTMREKSVRSIVVSRSAQPEFSSIRGPFRRLSVIRNRFMAVPVVLLALVTLAGAQTPVPSYNQGQQRNVAPAAGGPSGGGHGKAKPQARGGPVSPIA